MYNIIIFIFCISIMFYLLALVFIWIRAVTISITEAESNRVKYSYVKAKDVRKWAHGNYMAIYKDTIRVYLNRSKKDFLYSIDLSTYVILTVYGVAILSSPIQLFLLQYYIIMLKRIDKKSYSLYSKNLFKNKFNV